MEAKRVGVTGGLNYDEEPFIVKEGDGRLRQSVDISDNGVVVPVSDLDLYEFNDIQFVVADTQAIYILNKNGSAFTLYKYTGKTYPVYGKYLPLFTTTETLVVDKSVVSVSCSEGKILIVNPGEDPIYLDLRYINDLSDLSADKTITVVNGYVAIVEDSEPSIGAGDTITFYSPPRDVNRKVNNISFAGLAKVLSVSYDNPIWHVVLDIREEYLPTNSIKNQSVIYGLSDVVFPLSKPYINLNRPVPHLAPLVFMETDVEYKGNNFIDTVYAYGYSFVYADGYETPISAMTEINLTAQRNDLLSVNTNKAVIAVRPYNGVSKVKFYCKRNNESNDLELIAEKDAYALTICEFYGENQIGVNDNTLFVKSSESVPLGCLTGMFTDNRIVLGAETSMYDNGNVKFGGTVYETWYKITGETVTANSTTTIQILSDRIRYTFSRPVELSFSPENTSGYYGLDLFVLSLFNYEGGYICSYTLKGGGNVFYSNESKQSVGDRLAAEISEKLSLNVDISDPVIYIHTYLYQSLNVYSDSNGNIIIEVLINHEYTGTYSVGNWTSYDVYKNRVGDVAYDISLKLGEKYELGVQFFDESGRTGGIVTSDNATDFIDLAYSTDSVQVIKPRAYLNNIPSWAAYYQFAVKRRINTNRHAFIPGKNTVGSWGTTSNAYKKKTGYGLLALNLLTVSHEDSTAGVAYSFSEGDYIRLYRLYHTNGTFGNIEVWDERSRWCRIADVMVDGGVEYVAVEDMPDIEDEYNTEAYLQFEIKNYSAENTDGIWQLIGDRYCVDEINQYYYSPEWDGYRHNIDWGDYIVRPITGLFYDVTMDMNLYVESKYINDKSLNKRCFSANRVSIELSKPSSNIYYLAASRPYIDGTNSNGYCVFDYDMSAYLTSQYGVLRGFERIGNRFVVFFDKGLYIMNINTIEAQSETGGAAVYAQIYFGNGRYIAGFGCADRRLVCNSGVNIYYYDTERKAVNVISDNGIYDISGMEQHVNGVSNKCMRSLFINKPKAFHYGVLDKKVYVSFDTSTYIYSTMFDRWTTKRMFSFDGGVYFSGNFFYKNNLFILPGTTYNMINAGEGDVEVGTYDLFIPLGEDVDFLSLFCYSDYKPTVDVNVYGEHGGLFKTTIKPAMWTRISDGYYCDIPKGSLFGETLRTHHLYEGYDMVGKSIQLVVYIEGKFYGMEVRYDKRNY